MKLIKRCLQWLCCIILLIATALTGTGCGTNIQAIPSEAEEAESSGSSKNQTVIKVDGVRGKVPVFAEEITDVRKNKYLSFVEFMDSRSTQPRFIFDSVDHLSERDKFEFARSIGLFLVEQNPKSENEPVSVQKDNRTIYWIPVETITWRVKTYLDSSFDPLAAFGASRGSMVGDDFLLGYDKESGEYIFQEEYNENTHSVDESLRYGLLGFTETQPHHYTIQVGIYETDYPAEEKLGQYALQYTYDLVVEEDAADQEQFTIRSSIFTKYEPDDNVKVLNTPWDYQTPGWYYDSARMLVQIDNRVTKPGNEMSEDEVLEQFIQLLPAGFNVRMWYMDNDALALKQGNVKPMTIDNRGKWLPIERYISINQMKAATQTVLSKSFCESVLYPNGFDDGKTAKYKEFNLQIYSNQDTEGVADYITFRTAGAVVMNQEADALTIIVPYSPESAEVEKKFLFEFIIINENGRWVFDNWPTI